MYNVFGAHCSLTGGVLGGWCLTVYVQSTTMTYIKLRPITDFNLNSFDSIHTDSASPRRSPWIAKYL